LDYESIISDTAKSIISYGTKRNKSTRGRPKRP